MTSAPTPAESVVETAPGGRRRAVVSAVAGGLVLQGFGAVTGPLLAHLLGSAGRGVVAEIQAPYLFAVSLAGLGFSAAAARYEGVYPTGAVVGTTMVVQLAVAVPVGVGLAFVYPAFVHGGPAGTFAVTLAYSAVLPLHLLALVVQGIYLGRGAGPRWNLLRLLPFALNLAFLLVGLLVLRIGPVAAASAQALAFVGWCACAVAFTRGWGRPTFNRRLARQVVRSALVVGLANVSQSLFSSLDQLYVAARAAPAVTGSYVVGYAFAGLVEVAAGGVAFVAFRDFKRDPASRLSRHAEGLTLLLSVVGAGLLALAAPVVIPFAFGGSFRPAVTLVWLLLPGRVFSDLYQVVTMRLVATHRDTALIQSGTVSILVIGSAVVLGWALHGPRGVAVGASVGQLLRYLVARVVSARSTGRVAPDA